MSGTEASGADAGKAEAQELAARLRLIADPVRVGMLQQLAQYPGTLSARDLQQHVGTSQPNISKYVKILADAGVIVRTGNKRGNEQLLDVDMDVLGKLYRDVVQWLQLDV